MFRLDNVLEKWAEVYEPLKHDPAAKAKHKTFFRTGMIDQQSYFIRNYNTMPSPFMAFVTHLKAETEQNPKFATYRDVVFFFVRQDNDPQKTDVTDELAATEARYDTDEMVHDLLAFLEMMQAAANSGRNGITIKGLSGDDHFFPITDDERQGWRGMKLNEASWETLPPLITGWQWCALTFDRLQPRMICIRGNKYI